MSSLFPFVSLDSSSFPFSQIPLLFSVGELSPLAKTKRGENTRLALAFFLLVEMVLCFRRKTNLITAPLNACLAWSSSISSDWQGITSASVYLIQQGSWFKEKNRYRLHSFLTLIAKMKELSFSRQNGVIRCDVNRFVSSKNWDNILACSADLSMSSLRWNRHGPAKNEFGHTY